MHVCIMEGKFYLIVDGSPYGWYGIQVPEEVYDSLKNRDFDNECDYLGDMLERNGLIDDYGDFLGGKRWLKHTLR